MKPGDHVRINAAKLAEAVGRLGRYVGGGEVRLSPPLAMGAGCKVFSVWCKPEELEVVEPTQRHRLIMATIRDLVADFVYYDRKEDQDLPRESIESAIQSGEVTVDEMVAEFRKALGMGES